MLDSQWAWRFQNIALLSFNKDHFESLPIVDDLRRNGIWRQGPCECPSDYFSLHWVWHPIFEGSNIFSSDQSCFKYGTTFEYVCKALSWKLLRTLGRLSKALMATFEGCSEVLFEQPHWDRCHELRMRGRLISSPVERWYPTYVLARECAVLHLNDSVLVMWWSLSATSSLYFNDCLLRRYVR